MLAREKGLPLCFAEPLFTDVHLQCGPPPPGPACLRSHPAHPALCMFVALHPLPAAELGITISMFFNIDNTVDAIFNQSKSDGDTTT